MNRCIKYVSVLIMMMAFAAVASAGDPAITGWNNITKDGSPSITVNESDGIYFNATADQNITTWHWFEDGSDQSHNSSSFKTSWSANGTYSVAVNATNGTNTSNTVPWTITVNDVTPPPKITGLTHDTPTASTVNLTWDTNGASDLVGYRVYQDGSQVGGDILKPQTYYNATLASSTSYVFNVSAYDDNSLEGERSDDVSVTTAAGGSSTTLTISNVINATLTSDSVTITWDTADEASDSLVKYGTTDPGYLNDLNESIGTLTKSHSITLTNLTPDTTYHFAVNSTNASNGNTDEDSGHSFKTQSSGYSTGNRIWEAGSCGDPYRWTAQSFTGFYYDLDTGESTETLTIKNIGQTIDAGDIEYVTKTRLVEFDCSDWGKYNVIGFMAEKYFAGYDKDETEEITDDAISLVSDKMLSKVLIDEDDRYTVSTGASLELQEGYELKIIQLDASGDKAQIELLRNGKSVDTGIVDNTPATYVYTRDIGKADDVPLIAIHVDSVFSGTETDMLVIKGIFQISEDYKSVETGDTYGEMEITSPSATEIKMKNDDDISLDEGEIVDLMGNIKFLVADDSSTLRFALYEDITEPGTHDIRGTVYNTSGIPTLPIWTHMNFEGFYYDIDDNLGKEELKIEKKGTNIGSGELVYTTDVQSVTFDYSGWGKYNVIGFMAEKYFAGYEKGKTKEITDETISLVSDKMLSKVLIDEDDRYTVSTGASLELQEGYELKIIQLDASGDKAQIELLRNGKSVDTGIVDNTPATYVYTRDIGKADDVPLIAIHVDSVFSGTETDMLVIKGIFQISEDYKSVKNGDRYGEMEITSTSKGITMKNDDDIDLDEGGTTMIMGDVGFKTSENGERYCLFVRRTIGSLPALKIDVSDSPIVDTEITITITSDGSPVEGAEVTFDGTKLSGLTDSSGEIRFTSEEAGTFTITATKEDYDPASEEIRILTEDEAEKDPLEIAMLEKVDPGADVVIKVTSDGDAIEGASIIWDGEDVGETDETGSLTYTAEDAGTYTVTASKAGYRNASETIRVAYPSAEFELADLAFPAETSANKKFTITVDVTNAGDADGTYLAELMVDGTVVASQNVTLDVGETETALFTHKISSAGTYTIEIGSESGEIAVTKSGSNTAIVAAALIVLAALGAIGYVLISSTPEGGWTVEKLIEAIKDKFRKGGKGL